ncbi:MAG: hypothetical protein SF029_15245 [bacterium]|nr:hypothetical protein [bacterium]
MIEELNDLKGYFWRKLTVFMIALLVLLFSVALPTLVDTDTPSLQPFSISISVTP